MSKQAKTLSDETVRAIREEVDAGIKSRLADYQRQVKAFLAGLSVFLLLILGDHFLRNDQFVNFLREQVVAFGPQLARFLGKKVAFSYSNEYWIQAPTYQEESLAFFASEPQEVTALINIVHKGTGPRLPISYSLDFQPPIRKTEQDITWEHVKLDPMLWNSQIVTPAEKVHYLSFRIEDHDVETDDRVFIRVLVNVIGLEKGDQ